jgi:Glutathione S-transferase
LADIYGLEWTISLIDIDTDEQKKPWFLKLNPNGWKSISNHEVVIPCADKTSSLGRIPVLIDNSGEQPFPIMESSAILIYLLEKVDKDHHFGFSDVKEQSQLFQWLIFWHASGQPNQGQLNHFGKFAPADLPCKYSPSNPLRYLPLSNHLMI